MNYLRVYVYIYFIHAVNVVFDLQCAQLILAAGIIMKFRSVRPIKRLVVNIYFMVNVLKKVTEYSFGLLLSLCG